MRALPTKDDRRSSVQEIAAHLDVNPDTAYMWIERKKLPAHKDERLWKFKDSQVDDWVQAGEAPDTDTREKTG